MSTSRRKATQTASLAADAVNNEVLVGPSSKPWKTGHTTNTCSSARTSFFIGLKFRKVAVAFKKANAMLPTLPTPTLSTYANLVHVELTIQPMNRDIISLGIPTRDASPLAPRRLQGSLALAQPPGPTLRIAAETLALIRSMARENALWGAERIRGELLKHGIKASKRTVQKYRRAARPHPPGGQRWSTFLRNRACDVWACDFLQAYDFVLPPPLHARVHRTGHTQRRVRHNDAHAAK
jgi:hypothetical protein